jgi:hypothetical protein
MDCCVDLDDSNYFDNYHWIASLFSSRSFIEVSLSLIDKVFLLLVGLFVSILIAGVVRTKA